MKTLAVESYAVIVDEDVLVDLFPQLPLLQQIMRLMMNLVQELNDVANAKDYCASN